MEPNVQDRMHDFRKAIDALIQTSERELAHEEFNGAPKREMALVRTKLQEAKMWVGKCLEVLGSQLPAEFRDNA